MSVLTWQCAPTRILSRTESREKEARFWKVRPMPISAMRLAALLRMLFPSKRMSPAVGV